MERTESQPEIVEAPLLETLAERERERDPYRKPCIEREAQASKAKYDLDGDDSFWHAHVAKQFKFVPTPRGWSYQGDCPRCCHLISEPLEQVRAMRAVEDVPLTVECDCTATHAGAPAGKSGCGRSGIFTVRIKEAPQGG